jgi:hypothetical protein
MARTKDYLEQRGAMVSCASYSVDKTVFYGETPDGATPVGPSPFAWLPIHAKHRLWPRSVRLHHAALVHAILSTNLHYNLDFPSISLRVPKFSLRDVQYVVTLLSRLRPFRRIADVSTPVSIASGVPRLSALLYQQDWGALTSPDIIFRPYGKARLTILPEHGEIRLTPVLQLALLESSARHAVVFENTQALTLWQRLAPPSNDNDAFYRSALFKLLTAFVGTVLGAELCQLIESSLAGAFSKCEMSFITEDTRVVLGEANAQRLASVFNDARDGRLGLLTQDSRSLAPSKREAPNAPALRDNVLRVLSNRPPLRICPEEMLCESVGKVFLALREATDSPECRRTNPTAGRLDTGLTYEGVRAVLESAGGRNIDDDDLSLTIDMCVDRGLVVPKVVKDGNTWLRAFYFGEGEDDQDPLQFKNAFHLGYAAFLGKRRPAPLSPFDVQKLCVCLKSVMPWLPISVSPFTYGYAGFVGHEQLIPWLTEGATAPCRIQTDGNRRIVVSNPEYASPVNAVWQSADHEREFFDAFDYVATAFLKMTANEKLLLTTCRTHRHAFNAVAFEAHAWASFENHGFGEMIVDAEQKLHAGGAVPDSVARSLFYCIRYVSEAFNKYSIFHHDYKKLLKGAKRAFSLQGAPAIRWWAFLGRRGLLDPEPDREIARRFSHLMPLLDQMRTLTAFAAGILDESGLVRTTRLEAEFRSEGASLDWQEFRWFTSTNWVAAAKEYNRALDQRRIPGRSFVRTRLTEAHPGTSVPPAWGVETIGTCRRAFDELAKALREYCKQYEVDKQEFPFAPDVLHKQLEDGSTEERRDNVFLLTMDVIKGTNAQQTNRMKDEIRAALRTFRANGLVFGDTGDDAFVAVCDDPAVLWDAAAIIGERGESLLIPGQAFGGTRKGLFFGSVAVIQKPSGETLIRDVLIPNTIPRACYILFGIDRHVEASVQNRVLIVDAGQALARCAGRLGLDSDTLPRLPVASKHFDEECVIVSLL